METGAMSAKRVLDEEKEDDMTPSELAEELLRRTSDARLNAVPVNKQYTEENKKYAKEMSIAKMKSFRLTSSNSFDPEPSNDAFGGLSFNEIADVDLAD
jgi:hypothetical protein